MDFGIKGKTALITGSGRGIGRSIAINLAKEGCNIVAISRSENNLITLLDELPGKNNLIISKDLTEDGCEKQIIKYLEELEKVPDILINNLGDTLGILDPLCDWEDWNRVWTVDMKSTIEFSRLIIPYMQKKQWGRIVNISSLAGLENQGPVTHCTIKSAMIAYSRCMGRIYAKDGIVISCVNPGAIMTENGHWDKVMKERPEHGKKYLENIPYGKFGEPEDIGTIVTMLCSQQAKFCQGSIIPVDGGQSKHFFWSRDY
jgi:3-oxoacyl-[acyl-carrier protein] reductase